MKCFQQVKLAYKSTHMLNYLSTFSVSPLSFFSLASIQENHDRIRGPCPPPHAKYAFVWEITKKDLKPTKMIIQPGSYIIYFGRGNSICVNGLGHTSEVVLLASPAGFN